MHILENVDLRLYSTMRLGGKAKYLAEAATEEKVRELVNWAKAKNLNFIVVGQGSNIVWQDNGFGGLIIVNKITGREVLEEDEDGATVKLGAGENWDQSLEWSIKEGFSGLEFLSRIPGTVGAAPVQNIGAYGVELSDFLKEVDVYDSHLDKFVCLMAEHCGFAYRTSRFKTDEKGRYVILSATLRLYKSNPSPPFYESLQKYLDENGIQDFTPQIIRHAVTEIRKIKLPDPSIAANNGSFFINPIVGQETYEKLKHKYPEMKAWPHGDKYKLSAGWLLEHAGLRGFHDQGTGMATWEGSALVLVNEKAKKTADLLAFKQQILGRVKEMYGIGLKQEPELLP